MNAGDADRPAHGGSESIQSVLEEQLSVQKEIARLSRALLSLDFEEIGAGIERELSSAGALAKCEQVRLIHLDLTQPQQARTFDWSADDVCARFPPIDRDRFTWSASQLLKGDTVHVSSVSILPDEAEPERRDLESRGVRAILTIPVRSSEALIGFQVFERTREEKGWTEQEITLLQLVAEIFVSAAQRLETEGALRESEERFRTIAEQATELVAEFDAKGRYCYVSPSYQTLLGHSPKSLLGKPGNRLIHPDDVPGSSRSFVRSFDEGVESHSIHRLRHASGAWRWYENSGQAYTRADGETHFVSIGHDITDRIESQRALERQLEFERTIAALSRRLLGLREEDLRVEISRSLEETALVTKAERAFLVWLGESSGEPGAFFEWHADGIEPWKRARRPWMQSALERGEILHFPDIDSLPVVASAERKAIEEQGFSSILVIPVRHGDFTVGIIGFAALERREWREDEITLLGLIGEILSSAVQRQQAERALRESQRQLIQSQKLEAVGRLAGGIAHDFNNLLTVILGLCRPILRELEEGTDIHADLEEVHGAAERAAALTRQLLTFSRRQPIKPQIVDLNHALEVILPLLARILGEDIDLKVELGSELPCVLGDPHQFEQVVVNLAANARDAMPTGGRLQLATEVREADAALAARIGLETPGRYVVLSAVDSGEGMNAGTQQQIFDPFFTTKETGKGTGLGLSIVYSVIEQAGGAIEVESAPGQGTMFHLWIPATNQEAEAPHVTELEVARGGTELVLFVEDEPAVRRFGRRILEQAGYRVLEAYDGVDALARLEQAEGVIDALVTDIVMPKLGGDELARRIRTMRPDLPVLFVSGHPGERGRNLDLPRVDLVQKPFTAELFLGRLRALLDQRD
jgi:PAS domain S-box-containing protein